MSYNISEINGVHGSDTFVNNLKRMLFGQRLDGSKSARGAFFDAAMDASQVGRWLRNQFQYAATLFQPHHHGPDPEVT